MTLIRLVIVDDHEVFRNGLREYAEVAGMHVVGEASNAVEAVDVILDAEPDVVVMDLKMAGGDGLTAIRTLASEQPDIPIVVVSGYDERARIGDALCAGAAGFVLKTCSSHALLAALAAAARGLTVLDRTARSHVWEALEQAAPMPTAYPFPSLSRREREVLSLLAEGKGPSQIARDLSLEHHTVHNYLSNIVRKLGVPRDDAAAVARAHGLGNGSRPDSL